MSETWWLLFAVGAAWGCTAVCYLRMRWWRGECLKADNRVEILKEVVGALVAGKRDAALELLRTEARRMLEKS